MAYKHLYNRILTDKFLIVFLLTSMLMVYTGCRKSEPLSWDTDLLVPLLKTRVGLSEIIPDSFLANDCQNWAYLDYQDDVYALSPDSLLQSEQLITNTRFSIPATLTLQPGQTFVSSDEETTLEFEGAEIRNILIDSGILQISLFNPLMQPIVCHYSLPGSYKQGKPFEARVVVPAATSMGPGTIALDQDIGGYTMDLTGLSGLSYNKIRVSLEAIVDSGAQAVQVTPFDTIVISAGFQSIKLREVHGYFGQHEIKTGSSSIFLKSLDYFQAGTLTPETLSASLILSNGAGMDIILKIKYLKARNSKTNATYQIIEPFIDKPIHLGRATLQQGTVPTVIPLEHPLVFQEQTLKKMLEILPDHLDYEMEIYLNPLGNVSLGNDFFYHQSPLKARFELLFPLSFTAEGLTVRQTVDFSYTEENIHEGELYFIADNYFPFDILLNARLLDQNGVIIDSLMPVGTVQAGHLWQPDILEERRTILAIPCEPARIERLKRTKKMLLDVIINTKPDGSPVRLKHDYHLDLLMSAHLSTFIKP